MKKCIRVILFFALMSIGAMSMQAQFTQAFLMKEALPNARKVATDSGWVKPKLVAVATIGDTNGLGQASALLGSGFSMSSGKSPLWVYVIAAEDTQGKPTTKLVAFVKIGIGPLATLQQVPLPADAVPTDIPFTPEDSIPTTTVLNSDVIASRVSANNDYKTFSTAHPKAKPQFLTLFTLPFEIPNTAFTAGTPCWNFNFANSADTNEQSLSCFVHAVTGEVMCNVMDAVSVQEEASSNILTITPNPNAAGLQSVVTIPEALYHPNGSMTVVNVLGETVFTVQANINAGYAVVLPNLSAGSYFIRYSSPNGTSTTPFIQQ